jgi:sulfite reductase alpha subunit-like flavoprotein
MVELMSSLMPAGRTVLEALEDFKSAALPLEWLLQVAPRLQPRLFSISSSLRANPGQAHVTAAVVAWLTPFKTKRKARRGLAARFFDGFILQVSAILSSGTLR